jgi:calcium/calmodulin-dependent protein kinase (CaM kinase) II
MNASAETTAEIVQLTEQLLHAIVGGDWSMYAKLCHHDLTCFEPEALGHLVSGLDFHRFYFPERPPDQPVKKVHVTVNQPHVWATSEMAVIGYVRLVQTEHDGTRAVEETRVWQRIDGRWQHIHFHRSRPST